MLELNPETICFLVSKAKEFHAKEEVVIPDEPLSPSEDWARQVLADHDDDLTYQEFKAAVDDLEPDQQATLVALMWLGRGDYDEDQGGRLRRRHLQLDATDGGISYGQAFGRGLSDGRTCPARLQL